MTTLTEFLLARIAEDEAVAKAAFPQYAWYSNSRDVEGRRMLNGVDEDAPDFDEDVDVFTAATKTHATHIARHDPARALAECEAKKQIVEWHGERDDCCEERYGEFTFDTEPEVSAGADVFGNLTVRQSIGFQPYIGCVTLMHLAAVYADHPDYNEEWRP